MKNAEKREDWRGETSGKKEKAEGEKKKEESRKRKFQERKEEAEKRKKARSELNKRVLQELSWEFER